MRGFYTCTSVSACAASFVVHALPYLQFVAVLISIIAGIKALRSKK